MYRKTRFKNRVLLSGQCAYGRRLLIKIYGSLLEDNVNKRVNPEEGC